MERSRLQPTSAASSSRANNADITDAVGKLYGSVKLKSAARMHPVGVKVTLEKDEEKSVYEAVKLKPSGATNISVSKSAINKSSVFLKGEVDTNVYEAVSLKKTTGVDKYAASRKIAVTTSSSFDSFDSIKLRKAEKTTRPTRKDQGNDPAYAVDALKSTGKVERAKHFQSEPELSDSDSEAWLGGVLSKATGDTAELKKQAVELNERILAADGFGARRRLSISDNDLVTQLLKATQNDASVTEIVIDGDDRFKNIKPDIVVGFAEGMRTNLQLRKLVIRNVGLGNDFLSALADSIGTNFMLKYVDLSHNAFTNDGLADFCVGMADNESLKFVDLSVQHSPIFTLREDLAVEALTRNAFVQDFRVEFQTDACLEAVQNVLKRNNEATSSISDYGTKLIDFLEKEATAAERRKAERKNEVTAQEVQESNMSLLYELSNRATKYKLPYESTDDLSISKHNKTVKPTRMLKTSIAKIAANILTADGSFLTEDFIAQCLHSDDSDGSLAFDFNNQAQVFKRFSITDPDRAVIVKKFVDALVSHPRSGEITHIGMVNTLIGNDFLVYLCERCLEDRNLLPNLHLLNLETNFISGPGVMALAKCVGNPDTWKYLQAIKLDNQKHLISSVAEDELARALCLNRSVIKLSLRVRNLFERRNINNYIARNIDFLRQARRWHAIRTGTVKERTRNKTEMLFDSIAANDPGITSVHIVADQVFLTIHPDEVIKAAASFATNTHVTNIKMSGLRLDDKFAVEMAKSLVCNQAIEKLDLETNMIGSEGQIAIVSSLSVNRRITELLLRHQSKSMASSDEERIAENLADNTVIVKLGVDVRSTVARHGIDGNLRRNQELKRKGAPKRAPSGVRNRLQQLFDCVASNDPALTVVTVVCDQMFLAMNPSEILKTAQSFWQNTHVKQVKMSGIRLDDEWAAAMAKSLETNTTLEKIDLESNAIGSNGVLSLIACLSQNVTVTELLLRHQTKHIVSTDEELIPGLIADNDKIVKLGVDVRSVNAKSIIDKKLRRNQELRRKNRNTRD